MAPRSLMFVALLLLVLQSTSGQSDPRRTLLVQVDSVRQEDLVRSGIAA
jgi:hypothetical protein